MTLQNMTLDQIQREIDQIKREIFSLQRSNDDEYARVVVYGLLNAGKSSLLNMLTDHLKEDYFGTGDIRVTTSIQKERYNQFEYIDTPGLDANEDDDEVASIGAKASDIILFVHQANRELEKEEYEFLENVAKSFGRRASKSVVLIISKIDGKNADELNEIVSRIKEQCKQYLRFTPKTIQISNNRYRKGVLENKNNMIEKSGIPELKKYLNSIADEAFKNRYSKQETRILELRNKVSEKIKMNERVLSEIRNSVVNKEFADFNQKVDKYTAIFDDYVSRYDKIS